MKENNDLETRAAAKGTVNETENTFNLGREVFEWIYTIVIALVIAFLIKGFIFDIVRVDGPSMYPTLVNNDRLIITKVGYKPHQGDIIILDSAYKNIMVYYSKYEENNDTKLNPLTRLQLYMKLPRDLKIKYYVKRIIGMPGDTIDLKDGRVYVNGELLDEPYYDGLTPITDLSVSYPVTVSDDCVFVMGDNRPNSKDSRSSELGEVPIKAISGKAQLRIWPFNSVGITK